MLVSIIIPVYNKEDYIDDCIMSVIYQDYDNIEIIIINDGSKDNSDSIIKEWSIKDTRIKYVVQENKGVAQARNLGMSISNGDYIYFLDADDMLEKKSISKLVSYANKSKADIIIGNLSEKVGNNVTRKPSYGFQNMIYNEKDLNLVSTKVDMFIINGRYMSMAGNKLYKLSFIRKYEVLFMKGVIAEDRLFNLICYVNKPVIQVVNEYTYVYSKLDNSRSRKLTANYYEECISLLNHFYNYLSKKYILKNNIELFELVLLYDVYKIINQVFECAERRISLTNLTVKEMKKNPLIMDTIANVFKQNKFNEVGEKSFKMILLINYLLFKAPYFITTYKLAGYYTRAIRYKSV